ncbi:MAG: class II SORL domain-containing protein [Candidatus Aminicenantes bacterium]|nr:class II SORL domain-containing protein [Candidatus Aminicenantes bacterium]
MSTLKDHFQSADWKKEKHVPVIEVTDKVKKGEFFDVKVTLGKEVAHPNKTEHHIRWIDVYFFPQGGKFPYHIGKAEFNAHGESTEGPDTSTVYTHHQVVLSFKTDHPGTIYAASYCNIHGLWENSKDIDVL